MKKAKGKKKGPPSSPPVEAEPQTEAVQAIGLTEDEGESKKTILQKVSYGGKKKAAPVKEKRPAAQSLPLTMSKMKEAQVNVGKISKNYTSASKEEDPSTGNDYLSDIKSFKKTALKSATSEQSHRTVDDYNFDEGEYRIPKGRPITLDYQRLYTNYLPEDAEAYPIHKLKYILLLIGPRSDTTLDFSGVGVLTDIVFALMADLVNKETARLNAVTSVVLDGCYQITDAGLAWLGEAFPNLTWLSCVGCRRVTDTGILAVSHSCPKLISIDLSGTQVTILPKRWSHAEGIRMNCAPVLYPKAPADAKASKYKQPPLKPEGKDLFSVVVAHPGPMAVSVLAALKGEKQPDADKLRSVQYQGNMSLTADITASVVESVQSVTPLFMTNRSVVVIPSTLKDKNKITDEATAIASLVVQIKAKHPKAPILLAGLSSDAQGIVPMAIIKEKVLEVIDKLCLVIREKFPVLSMPKKEGVVDSCDVSQQLELSRAISLMQGLTNLKLLDLEVNVDRDTKSLLSAIADAAKGLLCFEHVTYDQEIYDWALSFPSKCPKALKTGVVTLDAAAQTISSNSTFKERLRPFGAIQFLRDIGQFCVWSDREKDTLVANKEWMCSVLDTLMSVSRSGQNNQGQNHVIDDGTPVWLITSLKEEMEKIKIGWSEVEEVIRCQPSMFFSNGKTLTPWTSLSLEPSMDLDCFTNFDKDSADDLCLHMMTSYALDSNMTPAFLHSILAHAVKLHAPVHVWQTGVVINDTVVAVMIAASGYAKLLNLCVYIPFHARATDAIVHSSLVWHTLNRYSVIIDYFLATFGLQAEKIMRAPKSLLWAPEKVNGVVIKHKLNANLSENGCSVCGVAITEAAMLGAFNRTLKPSFWKGIKGDEKRSMECAIMKFTGKCVVSTRASINPMGEDECCIALMQGDVGHLKIIIQGQAISHKVIVDLKEKTILNGDKTENIASKLGEGSLRGCLLKVRMRGTGPYFMDFYMGPKLLTSENVPCERYDVSVDSNNMTENANAIASISMFGPIFTSRSPELRVGMRLEAFDRKTPTLICVATIDEMEDDQIHIHFDGWGGNYDYWTEWDTPDLHPLGYMKYMKEINGHKTRVNPKLQIPYRYEKEFTWPTYLKEIESEPVPYELFSDDQKQGTPPDATDEALDYLGISYDTTGSVIPSCSSRPGWTGLRVATKVLIKNASTEETPRDDSTKWHTFLPNNLSLETLRYPALKDAFDMNKLNLHILCNWQGAEFHFSNHPGIPVSKTAFQNVDKWAILQILPCLVLLLQKENLPANPSGLIPGSEKLAIDQIPQLELGLRRLLRLYLYYALVMKATMSANELVELQNSAQVTAKELVKTSMKDDKVFAQNFHCKPGTELIHCQAHALADSPQMDIQEIKIESFLGLTHRIYMLCLNGNPLTKLPDDLFTHFDNLTQLLLCNCQITELPPFAKNVYLEEIDVRNNKLTSLPDDIDQLKNLKILQISNNPLKILSPKISSLTTLTQLDADNIGKVDMNIVCKLVRLQLLKVSFNHIEELPEAFGQLPLQTLYIAGLPTMSQNSSFAASSINSFLDTITIYNLIEAKDRQEMIEKADSIGDNNASKMLEFNKILKAKFPQFTKTKGFKDGEIPPVFFNLKSLQKLHLSNHTFVTVPDTVKQLEALQSLNLEGNSRLESVSPELANLPLKELHLRDCAVLKTPPKEVVRRGFFAVFGFLKRLLQGSVLCKRTKLMMVGLGGAGKTSLVRALTKKSSRNYDDQEESITDGIDITEWSVKTQDYPTVEDASSQEPLRFSVWDFAGQTVYYNTHQFFLSNRAVYLLLWNIRLGFEHAGLDFWLSSVTCHAPKAPIVIVGTHCDKVERGKIPTEELKRKFPKIVAFHFVSSYSGEGIDDLRIEVIKSALKQEYMGEKIPEAWLSLETGLDRVREKKSLVKWSEIEDTASTAGIFDKVEMTQSVQFLHDLGSVQFFNTPFLKSHVVIVPQWIVDVMACIVTVHDGPTKEGKLKHKDMVLVWKDYPKELHPWLLRLTEEFDLTFPIANEDANIVPCLLPNSEPEYEFSPTNKDKREREAQMVYRFEYLPAGLFNRAQVRLHQFSDTSLMWKKGFMLKKNDHRALLLQMSNTDVNVTARGYKPENIIFLIHEVIECLIADSYAGVSYDFSLPCLDCASDFTLEPSMFHASKVKRALEMKAPFLQCDKHFHIVSIPEIRAAMPPDRESDFDEHLSRSVRELQELGESTAIKCLFIYSKKDVPNLAQEGKAVNPIDVLADLRKEGFNVSYCDDPETANMETMTLSIKSAQSVIIGISDECLQSEQFKNLIIYTKQTLSKNITLLVFGPTTNWMKTDINLVLADELFVRMADLKSYPIKLKELTEAIKSKVLKKNTTYPDCFISYCWANSKAAVELGMPKKDEALGWADPRGVKDFLQSKGVNCWLDVNQMGQEGFFEDIADGLRKAKVMVACVSDEYANSKNCKMEFRFALSTLKIPTVIAVVGTGYLWERSEIGLLIVGHSTNCPKINLQYPNEGGMLDLLKAVQEFIPVEDKNTKSKKTNAKSQKDVALQEVLELAQRKLLRQIMMYAENLDTEEFPRLIVIDLLQAETKRAKDWKPEIEEQESADKAQDASATDDTRPKSETYCFRLFCEHELGWHESPVTISIPEKETTAMNDFLSSVSAYTVRLMAVLKHTKNNLPIFNKPAGEQLQRKMEEWCNRTNSDFQGEYKSLLDVVLDEDMNRTFGGLKKCNMPNKKSLWLCPMHQKHSLTQTEGKFKDEIKTDLEGSASAMDPTGEDVDLDRTGSSISEITDGDMLKEKPQEDVARVRSVTIAKPSRGPALPPSRPKLNRHVSGKKTQSQACLLM